MNASTPKKPGAEVPKMFEVRLARTSVRYLRIQFQAATPAEAKRKALDGVGDLNFFDGTEGEPKYRVDESEEVIGT